MCAASGLVCAAGGLVVGHCCCRVRTEHIFCILPLHYHITRSLHWRPPSQMASALQHIHGLGLAHLDIKPDNIYRGLADPDTFKLGDFGLATASDGSRGLITEGDAR